ncbi:MAG: glycosyltransferase [Kiritimatiellae bacterium]|nr:glycosyltransferase [Kiritimatiellia bacterium]
MKSIHQFVAGFSHGDAISNETLMLRDIFRSWGYQSEIFSEAKRILPELRREAHDAAAFAANCHSDDVVLLHLSIGSPVNRIFAELPCKKAILYHNITPPEFLQGIQEQIASHLARGREEMKMLAGKAQVVMADSRFNAEELESMGYGKAEVLPLVLDLDKLKARPHRPTVRKYADGLVNVIFVGRCVPNKRIEDVLRAFYYFQKYVEPHSRLIHAGSFAGTEQYHALLLTQARDMGLRNMDLVGSVPQDELNAVYSVASMFLCMSEHEGFCIPLIESMVHDVPVIAFAAAAVPETMDGAGILIREKRFDVIAEMMGRVLRDEALRRAVIEGQRQRLQRYRSRDLAVELKGHLGPLLA